MCRLQHQQQQREERKGREGKEEPERKEKEKGREEARRGVTRERESATKWTRGAPSELKPTEGLFSYTGSQPSESNGRGAKGADTTVSESGMPARIAILSPRLCQKVHIRQARPALSLSPSPSFSLH